MSSLSITQLFRQAREVVYDPEDAVHGDIDSKMADAVVRLFEAMAESEVEKRVGIKVSEARSGAEGPAEWIPFTARSNQLPHSHDSNSTSAGTGIYPKLS